jgi:ABC-type cobalamin/Fe3+-siderophores transport system ATPase subunit
MIKKVTLRKLKRIKKLEFEIPAPGVWIVTGLNGSGKTSLFAAIYRIGAQHAFQRYYRTSPLERRLDSYASTEIEYSVGDQSVKYHYGGQRWRATPSRNASFFSQFHFTAVDYVEANGERIEPFADEIIPRKLRNAATEVRSFMQDVLADEKWAALKYVNTRRGPGSDAYIIPYKKNRKTYYYSEKSFSLGELCVLKLAKKMASILNNSLVLIDEVEMALHPQAQVRLLQKVTSLAAEKNLTVLFSTHSATIIKNTPRKNLILLKMKRNGTVIVTKSAFPAQILGEIAFDDELMTDFIIYVEDKQAKMLTEELIAKYMVVSQPENRYRPLYKIVPVGGFQQVLEMLNTSSGIFPSHVKRFALLDEDVKTEALVQARNGRNQVLMDTFNSVSDKVRFLPCTPEVGVVELLEIHSQNNPDLMTKLCQVFEGQHINVNQVLSSSDYNNINRENPRDKAKERMKHFVEKVAARTAIATEHIRRILYSEYASHKYAGGNGDLKGLLGPIFNAR